MFIEFLCSQSLLFNNYILEILNKTFMYYIIFKNYSAFLITSKIIHYEEYEDVVDIIEDSCDDKYFYGFLSSLLNIFIGKLTKY